MCSMSSNLSPSGGSMEFADANNKNTTASSATSSTGTMTAVLPTFAVPEALNNVISAVHVEDFCHYVLEDKVRCHFLHRPDTIPAAYTLFHPLGDAGAAWACPGEWASYHAFRHPQ